MIFESLPRITMSCGLVQLLIYPQLIFHCITIVLVCHLSAETDYNFRFEFIIGFLPEWDNGTANTRSLFFLRFPLTLPRNLPLSGIVSEDWLATNCGCFIIFWVYPFRPFCHPRSIPQTPQKISLEPKSPSFTDIFLHPVSYLIAISGKIIISPLATLAVPTRAPHPHHDQSVGKVVGTSMIRQISGLAQSCNWFK